MSKLRVLVAAAAVGVATLTLAAPAHAVGVDAACDDDGHILNATAFYTPVGAYHDWYRFIYELSGAGTGGKSNVNIRLRENGTLRYAYNSPDDRRQNVEYHHWPQPARRLLAANSEVATFEAIFDEFGPDDQCTASTGTV